MSNWNFRRGLFGRLILQRLRVLVWKTGSPSGDEFGHGYNKAAAEIERAAEALKEKL